MKTYYSALLFCKESYNDLNPFLAFTISLCGWSLSLYIFLSSYFVPITILHHGAIALIGIVSFCGVFIVSAILLKKIFSVGDEYLLLPFLPSFPFAMLITLASKLHLYPSHYALSFTVYAFILGWGKVFNGEEVTKGFLGFFSGVSIICLYIHILPYLVFLNPMLK